MIEKTQKMRKTNMKIFPIYKALGWDYLFFYTIDFLFLTQVKGIVASDVVLKSTFYAFFKIILQIPSNIIVEFLGRRNSAILGNVLNCLYMVIIMLSKSLPDLILAEFFGSMAFSIKDISEPSLLNESIPASKYKSSIYSKISSKGASSYYTLNCLSKIVAGFLFTVNGYLPIILSLAILIIVTIMSIAFIEPVKKKKKSDDQFLYKNQLNEIKEGFTYVLKSERLKALILCASLIASLLRILGNYYVSLFEDLKISTIYISIIAAVGSIVGACGCKAQKILNDKLKNKTLLTISIVLSVSTGIAGIFGIINNSIGFIIIVVLMSLIYQYCNGIYYTIIERYLRNFTNEKIDTKIFATKNLFEGIFRVVTGLFASFLLTKTITAYAMIILSIIFTIIYILTGIYMKKRLGLKPEEYSKEERKYDELKIH